ncbi:hypothetical protein G5C60_04935 [Streptomyces sp. HC44]|uniref:Uncharacterized protein n=1 Tax=Streptomyces scabichelini TaxID=2711217 RepID=A0A6G4UZI2_9ACTN|nr:acyl-CoA thioesterase/bile acid-CoA:amino acid N-acyltransferase family protein [Streptomyces scabichelini]NGO07014.1 hypothetical protein [Streptomyces scabichelini]
MTALLTRTPVARVDEPIDLHCTGLPPHGEATAHAAFRSGDGTLWSTETRVRADDSGNADIGRAFTAVLAGAADGLGLMASMTAQPAAEPVRYSDMLTGSLEPLDVTVNVCLEGRVTAERTLRRTFLVDGVKQEQWREDHVADLFLPEHRSSERPVVVLGGAWGGFGWSNEVAALLAASGRPALAVCYFDWDGDYGRPRNIVEIPLEYVATACDRLLSRADVGSSALDLVGISKGAELALQLAVHRDDVRKLVAYAPTSHVWESVRNDPSLPARSSWSSGGAPVPFLRFDADDAFYQDLDKTRLLPFHERALAQVSPHSPARIPVERITADTLLIALRRDNLWPSAAMARAIARTMRRHGRPVRELMLEAIGHTLFVPGLPANSVDDTAAASARADRRSWEALHGHLGGQQTHFGGQESHLGG